MTVTVNNIYELGFLSEVSYGNFDRLTNDLNLKEIFMGEKKEIPDDSINLILSETQSADFMDNYEIVSHLPDTVVDTFFQNQPI